MGLGTLKLKDKGSILSTEVIPVVNDRHVGFPAKRKRNYLYDMIKIKYYANTADISTSSFEQLIVAL